MAWSSWTARCRSWMALKPRWRSGITWGSIIFCSRWLWRALDTPRMSIYRKRGDIRWMRCCRNLLMLRLLKYFWKRLLSMRKMRNWLRLDKSILRGRLRLVRINWMDWYSERLEIICSSLEILVYLESFRGFYNL